MLVGWTQMLENDENNNENNEIIIIIMTILETLYNLKKRILKLTCMIKPNTI